LTTGIDFLDTAVQDIHLRQHTGLDTLTKHPGLEGPLQIFHQAQQFKPLTVPPDPGADTPITGGLQSGMTYPVRLVLGFFQFLLDNILPFFIRSSFSLLALVVIIALIINITSKISHDENATEEETDEPTNQPVRSE
jgi:hypothetical protein